MFILICLVLLILSAYFNYKTSSYIDKSENINSFSIKDLFKDKIILRNMIISISSTLLGLSTIIISFIIKNKIEIDFTHYLLLILGTLILSFFFTYLFQTSNVMLYKKDIKLPIKLTRTLYFLIVLIIFIVGVVLFTEGIGKYLQYPLYNKITFNSKGISLSSYLDYPDGVNLTFYGLLILTGALTTYIICDYKFYVKYGKHGILENLLLVAFPMGLVGARLWYCLVLDTEYFIKDPISILYVWDGGLAVMGGVILGFTAGALYCKFKMKDVSLIFAIDTIVPCILVAQAIGRWGNFFNHEVYGNEVSASNWSFLPTFIRNQMAVSFLNGVPASNTIWTPLFFIESITNITGYIIISKIVGGVFKKYIKPGVLGSSYLIWYGLTRLILEPLRDASFEYKQSLNTAISFIAIGVALIIFIYIFNYIKDKKKEIKTE